ncbi:hypothetical protein M3Y96_01196600 [Aphelenchoides besseyi]|nr:hypothetical protein M3Y96_01196600 [Aphelenchoides besseyi]
MSTVQHELGTVEGLNATTSLTDLERQIVEAGETIRNRTIKPHEDLAIDDQIIPRLRLVDYRFAEKSLPYLHTVTRDYFHMPIETTFNWDEVADRLGIDEKGDWFIVAFRSVRKPSADTQALYNADALAHQEAIESGGLLKYWYGTLNELRQCLAMCIWSNRQFARAATVKPLHIQAVSLTRQMYESYTLERYRLIKHKGEAKFQIERLEECHRTTA